MKKLIVAVMMLAAVSAQAAGTMPYTVDYLDDGTEIAIFSDGTWRPTVDLLKADEVEVERPKPSPKKVQQQGGRTLELEYVKSSGSGRYTLVGIKASHKGTVVCRTLDAYGNTLQIDKTYVTSQYEEAMIRGTRGVHSVSCGYE